MARVAYRETVPIAVRRIVTVGGGYAVISGLAAASTLALANGGLLARSEAVMRSIAGWRR